jgi:hypothetical protein
MASKQMLAERLISLIQKHYFLSSATLAEKRSVNKKT